MQEMALMSHKTERVGSESLEKWVSVGSGGFGHVYKARHKDWGFDVAIKILQDNVRCDSNEEVIHMDKASCEFVLRVYGIYEGIPPLKGFSMQKGIVMELMSRRSVQDLLQGLSGPPLWPLSFRLAHQVALGMNFLHSRNLIHHDLKPSNVLLNDDLNAKLADFGLSRVSTSVLKSEKKEMVGGTYKYMPPEAFDPSYEPVRAFDIYSYGIFLWSVLAGKEPYTSAGRGHVALKIPMGDRPPCEDIDQRKAAGLKELVDLMKICWDEKPSERPAFKECLEVTETVFSKYKSQIHAAVAQVLERLDSPTSYQHSNTSVPSSFSPQMPDSESHDTVDHVRFLKTKRSSTQESVSVSAKTMSDADKAKFIDNNRTVLIREVCEVMAIVDELGGMVHSETYSVIEAKQTSEDKMRALFQRTLRSGGEKVKAAFYDILKTQQSTLMERLGG
ncbi:receptor-interacting serine/threonine-protein kinase 3-like isoform X3 [Toxotes jaculatrix]|uniref:receptor-interacting serine/threonine-protein kinase 3-like isoform X3 n=1 Tax=Toxotes jaculatrix TaxID=941984 RepID=UPI001B3AFDCA|nr:receptor-interacting serine/threonine-protein kinase 3-like isoform X3 [Toxotes jaculatrix]